MPLRFDVQRHSSIGSTSDEARRLARAGAAEGTVVVAEEQTAGRGRQGRSWTSAPGNLYVSIVLRPGVPAERLHELAFLAGLAVAEAVAALLPPGPAVTLKWPNDVLIDGAKVAGLLLEQDAEAAILGIGVNVAHHPEQTPYRAGALATVGARATPEMVLQRLLAAIDAALTLWRAHGFAAIRSHWLARAHPPGTPLVVRLGGATEAAVLDGRFAGIDAAGALLLDTAAGQVRIVAGEVARQDPSG